MRKIEAKIRKSKFKEVKLALLKEGFETFSYHLTRSVSPKSEKELFREDDFDSKSSERVDFSIYVNNKDVDHVIQLIVSSGSTGDAYDSFIGVFDIGKTYTVEHVDGKDKLILVI